MPIPMLTSYEWEIFETQCVQRLCEMLWQCVNGMIMDREEFLSKQAVLNKLEHMKSIVCDSYRVATIQHVPNASPAQVNWLVHTLAQYLTNRINSGIPIYNDMKLDDLLVNKSLDELYQLQKLLDEPSAAAYERSVEVQTPAAEFHAALSSGARCWLL